MQHKPNKLAKAVRAGGQQALIEVLTAQVEGLKVALDAANAEVRLLNSRLSTAVDKELLLLNKLIEHEDAK